MGGRRSRAGLAAALAAAFALLILASAAGRPAGAQEAPGAAAPDAAATEPAGPPPEPGPPPPEPVVPRFVRPIAGTAPGSNDANPVFSPDGTLVAFERGRGDGKEILIARPDGAIVKTVSQRPPDEGGMSGFLPGDSAEASFNAGISWSPSGRRFVFMSNGGEGNYDLYLGTPGSAPAVRLTDHREKDGHAHWSPAADNLIVFVSGRSGKGDLYLMDVGTRASWRLTSGGKAYLYPRWSPDGRRIAVTAGENENHDVYVIDNMVGTRRTMRALTSWPFDDIRPVFSPDGRKIAFYSNYNRDGNPRVWSIVVVSADGTDPRDGMGLAARVAATDVVPDVETGPAWMPDGEGLVFVKNDRLEYNPLRVVELATGIERPLKTETKMNHDVACAPDGTIAFRAQVDQWDHLFVARVEKRAPYR